MGKLHELIAAEEDLKGLHKKTLAETVSVFNNKATHFEESIQVFDSVTEGSETETEKHTPMITTVDKRLSFQGKQSAKYFDALLQKEVANSKAKANIVIGDTTLAEDVPLYALLGLERELKQLRQAYGIIPVLDPAKVWSDVASTFGAGVVENVAPKKERTKKLNKPLELSPATQQHKAQVVMATEDIVVGHTVTTVRSSKYNSAHKHDCLQRLDDLILAVKTARMRANLEEVQKTSIGDALFDYISTGKTKKLAKK